LNPVDWNFHFTLANKLIVAPQHLVAELAALAQAVSRSSGKDIPESLQAAVTGIEPAETHTAMAEMLGSDGNKMLILGQTAMAHEQASWLRQLSAWIAAATSADLNMVAHGGNSTGATLAGALPSHGCGGSEVDKGLNAREMLDTPVKTYLLWDVEPEFDFANPALAMEALASAESVVAVSSFVSEGLKAVAEVILPLAPLAESEGLFYRLDGQSQAVKPAVTASGNARPGWKILRVLGSGLELEGFSQVDVVSLRDEMLAEIGGADYAAGKAELAMLKTDADLYRVGEVAMYAIDALCRRSEYLQQTAHAENDFVGLNPDDAGSKGFAEGHEVTVSQGNGQTKLPVRICNELPVGAVWIKSATDASRVLGDSFGPVSVETA